MKYYFVLAGEILKLVLSPIILLSIRSEGVKGHVSFNIIYSSIAFNIVLSSLWALAQFVAYFTPKLSSHYEDLWKGTTLINLMLNVYYHDIVWVLVAWIRYTKVVRRDVWETIDMDLWRRRMFLLSWGVLAFILGSLSALKSIELSLNGTGEMTSEEIKEPVSFALLLMAFMFYGVAPWVLTLVPYMLILRFIREQSQNNASSNSEQSAGEEIFGIDNPQLQNVPHAWEGNHVPINSEESEKDRVFSTSLISIVVFFLIGLSKVCVPGLWIYGFFFTEHYSNHEDITVSIIVSTVGDLLNLIFVFYNCRNLVANMVSEFYEPTE